MAISGICTIGYIPDPSSVTITIVCEEEIIALIDEVTPDIVALVDNATQDIVAFIAEDCEAPAFDATLAHAGASVFEIGTVVNSPAFTATYNRPPVAARLTNNDNAEDKDVVATPNAFNSDLPYSRTTPNATVQFDLTADDGGAPDVASVSTSWRARLFTGWTLNPGPYVEADILALIELGNSLDANALFDITLSPTDGGAGAYLVAAYHDVFNGASPSDFEIGNFGNGDVTEVQTGVVVTIPNGTAPFSIARSDFAVESPGGIRFARES